MSTHPPSSKGRRSLRLGAGVVAGALAVGACHGSDADVALPDPGRVSSVSAELQEELEEVVAATGVPALAVAAVERDGLVELGVAGERARGSRVAVGPDDPFHIGSNGKAMTAALLGRLEQRGAPIGYDTTLASAFPDVDVHEDYVEITLGDVLAHVGGIPDTLPDDPALLEMSPVTARQAAAAGVLTAPARPSPSTIVYSNLGYVVVGAAMEAATGESWEQLMRIELFDPLNMRSCGFGPPGSAVEVDAPRGHDATGAAVHLDNPAALGPAGTIHCSLADWAAFVSELLDVAGGADGGVLSIATVDELLTPRGSPGPDGLRTALGWFVVDGPDGPVYFHDGSNTAWYSEAMLAPGRGTALLAASNEERTGTVAVEQALQLMTGRHAE